MHLTHLLSVAVAVALLLSIYVIYCLRHWNITGKSKRVLVLVLGDIGRSPRMQYHAISLASHGYEVHLVGYKGTPPIPALRTTDNVHFHYIPAPEKLSAEMSRLVYLMKAVLRTVKQLMQIFGLLLFRVPQPGYILVQNPPAIPTLIIVQCVRVLLASQLIIDWHNFGYSIMALSLGEQSRIVKVAKWYEKTFGKRATAHICVSKAMSAILRDEWHARGKIITLYDRSPRHFRRLSLQEIHEFTSRFSFDGFELQNLLSPSADTASALLTYNTGTDIAFRPDRPVLVVTSTSWTEDEDFGILLDAMCLYDEEAQHASSAGGAERLPNLVLVITGKGPQQKYYKKKIAVLGLRHVKLLTAWLEAEDYPLLLGCADLGISLHTSSSGVDLPMKIVDMFGCGLPVCAIGYPCLEELVTDGRNGRIFSNSKELSTQLTQMFRGCGADSPILSNLREGTKDFQKRRWDVEWSEKMKALFET